jgi:hypothetical protein
MWTTLGNFSSLYQVLLHDKDNVVFAAHMIFKYLPLDDIPGFLQDAGSVITKDPDVPTVEFVCRALRWFNQMNRIDYLLTKLEAYCDRRGRKAEFNTDWFAEWQTGEDYGEYCC